jgi:LPXTG-motif cell wall-anchored protein
VDVSLAVGGSATVTTGAVALAEISGTLWVDIDGDGIQDPGEAAVVGVTIELLDASGAVIGSVVSGPNGEYTFPDLLPGTYTLRIDPATIPSGIVLVGDASVVVVVDGTTGNTVLGIAFAEAPATLPNTGFMFLTLATMGLLLLAAGSLVLAAVRRRDEYGGV